MGRYRYRLVHVITMNVTSTRRHLRLPEAIVICHHHSACNIKSHPFILDWSLSLTLLHRTEVPCGQYDATLEQTQPKICSYQWCKIRKYGYSFGNFDAELEWCKFRASRVHVYVIEYIMWCTIKYHCLLIMYVCVCCINQIQWRLFLPKHFHSVHNCVMLFQLYKRGQVFNSMWISFRQVVCLHTRCIYIYIVGILDVYLMYGT